MRKYFNTEFEIGDKVWTCEYSKLDGLYHVFARYIDYIKLVENNVLYGFSYNIEVPRSQCFHTEEMAMMCEEEWNRKLKKESECYA